jgi:hypothetical protein
MACTPKLIIAIKSIHYNHPISNKIAIFIRATPKPHVKLWGRPPRWLRNNKEKETARIHQLNSVGSNFIILSVRAFVASVINSFAESFTNSDKHESIYSFFETFCHSRFCLSKQILNSDIKERLMKSSVINHIDSNTGEEE